MEKNQVTGIILITLLMLGYFMYVGNKEEVKVQPKADSLATLSAANPIAPAPVLNTISDSLSNEVNKAQFGVLAVAAAGESKRVSLENEVLKVTFNTQGGQPKEVLLKNYVTSNKQPLYLFDETNSLASLLVKVGGKDIDLTQLYYTPTIQTGADSSVLTFKISLSPSSYIEQVYTLKKTGYVVGYDLKFVGLDQVIDNKSVAFTLKQNLPSTENDNVQSRDRSTVNYYTVKDGFDNLSEASKSEETATIDKPLKWVTLKQKFFNTGFIASNTFEKGTVKSTPTIDIHGVKLLEMSVSIPVGDLKSGKGKYSYYFGPTEANSLDNVTEGYTKNLYLGYPVIREFNRYIVHPVFDFMRGFISNYGIIIILLGIFVKLILLPLSFKSQVSMAKMRVMKPELDELKEKYPDDMQKQQAEQMQLYQKVGINPLSGCIPVLLSMPVLLAMFSFFPNSIELRQQAFLWAPDLSTYDAPFQLPFTIPYYGSHVSIFTLLMTLSTLALTFFNNQMTTAQGPMKSVSYIMPVVFMFVLNSFPAGLSFYYFISNVLSIAQQKIMQQFVDEDKIKHQLEENRKKNTTGQGKKSKWMQRVEEAMKAKEEQSKQSKKK